MNKIIVGADFSKGSDMASRLAVDIANHFHENLLFIGPAVKSMSQAEMSLEITKLNKLVEPDLQNISIENKIYRGEKNMAEVLSTVAEKENATMIVVGTPVIAGLQKHFFGPDTYDLIEKSSCPVLSVREDFEFNPALSNILLPIDNTSCSRQKIALALRFAKTFGSTLHLLGVYEPSRPEIQALTRNYALQAQSYLEELGVKNTLGFVEMHNHVSEELRSYASKVGADMLILMIETGSKLMRYFADRSEHRTLTVSSIPVLTMPSEQLHALHI